MQQFQDLINQLLALLGGGVIQILAAIGILIVGWIVASALAGIVRTVLRRTQLDDRLANALSEDTEGARLDIEKWVSRGVYYVVMLFVVVAALQTLRLTVVARCWSGLPFSFQAWYMLV